MFRKVSILAVVAAAFAPVLVMAGERSLQGDRQLQQSPASYECPDQRCKAKEAALCIGSLVSRTGLAPGPISGVDVDTAQFQIYDCSQPLLTAEPIGFGGVFCSEPEGAPLNIVLCQAQISLRSCPKTNKATTYWDSLALSFFLEDDTIPPVPPGTFLNTIQSTVVTGTKGAWGKADNIVGVNVDPYTGPNGYTSILYLSYRGQGWDPTCTYKDNKNYEHLGDWN